MDMNLAKAIYCQFVAAAGDAKEADYYASMAYTALEAAQAFEKGVTEFEKRSKKSSAALTEPSSVQSVLSDLGRDLA